MTCVSFSPNACYAAIGTEQGKVLTFDTKTFKIELIKPIHESCPVFGLEWKDNSFFASVSPGKSLFYHSTRGEVEQKDLFRVDQYGEITYCLFLPEYKMAYGFTKGYVVIIDRNDDDQILYLHVFLKI